jgi:hypothetical protein
MVHGFVLFAGGGFEAGRVFEGPVSEKMGLEGFPLMFDAVESGGSRPFPVYMAQATLANRETSGYHPS